MRKHFIFLTFLFIIITSCTKNRDNAAYEKLKAQDISGQELLVKISNFEVEHSTHFESKVDLACFYLLTNEFNKAYEYAVRAESVINNAPKNKNGKKAICILNGTRAKLELYYKNYDKALEYVNKALSNQQDGKIFAYLKAQILSAMEKNQEALSVFDEAYKTQKENAVSEDLKSYMVLLALNERYEDAKDVLDSYFEKGSYFSNLGSFASVVYEKNKDVENSIYSTFLDYLFYSNFLTETDSVYKKNLDTLQEKTKNKSAYPEYKKSIDFIESYFTNDIDKDSDSDFFVAKYIRMHKKIMANNFSVSDANDLMALEKYFSIFPCFYWDVFTALNQTMKDSPDITNALEKIIILGNKNIYIKDAKVQLGTRQGLSKQDAEKILLPEEVKNLIMQYQASLSPDVLEPIFDLLETPENSYELATLVFLKTQHQNLALKNVLLRKQESCSAKLKERLDYILN